MVVVVVAVVVENIEKICPFERLIHLMLSVKLGTADGYASEEQVACIGGNGTIDELKEQRRHNVTGWTKQLLQSMTFCQS
ncbi:hypothetical protein T12_13285 [Trichinella patagoniensis]|uniref:Uncharacterized protein n=1 Tax=Trichinella patagoniensis TaxID=990121 RepID=A0A0V1A1E0_9BILA|nr:hypothetical protein T12_13285 [Trichinella patagoniensis]